MQNLQKNRAYIVVMLFGWMGTLMSSALTAQERSPEPSCTTVPMDTIHTWDGKPLFHHQFKEVPFKPCVNLLCTPSGRNVLRDSPWDHVHHHALMFAVRVDNVNFWEESDNTFGKQKLISPYQSEIQISPDGPTSVRDSLDLHWMDSQGNVRLCERRVIETSSATAECDATVLTWTSQLSLPQGVEQATLGGEHYYGLGLRFHSSMDKSGRFFSSSEEKASELVRGDEMLTRCRWMAYTAKLEGESVTVAVFDTPDNPSPMLAFTMGDAGGPFAYLAATVDLWRKPMQIARDQSIAFHYGVIVQDGETTAEQMEKIYQYWLSTQSIQPLEKISENSNP